MEDMGSLPWMAKNEKKNSIVRIKTILLRSSGDKKCSEFTSKVYKCERSWIYLLNVLWRVYIGIVSRSLKTNWISWKKYPCNRKYVHKYRRNKVKRKRKQATVSIMAGVMKQWSKDRQRHLYRKVGIRWVLLALIEGHQTHNNPETQPV